MDNAIELEVGEGRQDGTYTVRVLRSVTGGEPTATFTLDVAELLTRRPLIEATVLSSSVPARRVTSVVERPVRDMGQLLFESVFAGSVAGAYRASLGVARERGDSLQVVLRLTAAGLAALPWETLYDPEIGAYLCRKEPLIRHVPGPFTPEALQVAPPLRILGMVSSPRGLPLLDVEAERAHLSEALGPHIRAGRVELVWLDDVSWAGVHAALLEGSWHVLHFVGHGGYDIGTDEGVLAFVGAEGRADYVDASSLADLLDEAEPTPRLVVLNSCSSGTAGVEDLFSGTAATLVRSGIHAVAAMQFAVSDAAAIAFAKGFYTAIAHGRGIDEAVRSGRIGILGTGRGTLEWVTPVLYLRGAGTQLFTMPPVGHLSTPNPQTPPLEAGSTRPNHPEQSEAHAQSDAGPHEPSDRAADPPSATGPVPAKKGRRWLVLGAAAVLATGAITATALALLRGGEQGRGTTGAGTPATTIVSTVQREIPSTSVWTDMGLRCASGDTVQITVSGTVMHEDSATGKVSPDGLTDPYYHQWNVPGLPNANTVTVIGSLDQALPFFVVGRGTTHTCPREGELFLGVNDIGVANNSGAFSATITTSRSG